MDPVRPSAPRAACRRHPAGGAFPETPEANLAKIERLGRSVKRDHPQLDLLVLPELGVTGYSVGERFFDLAEAWPVGDGLRRLSALAAESGRRHGRGLRRSG